MPGQVLHAEVEDMIRTGIIIGDSSVAACLLFLLSEPADGGLGSSRPA
jgi:hypothetical protein